MKSLVIALALAVAARSGAAQAKCLEQVKFPQLGRWAQYQAVYKEDSYTLRYAVIGVEPRGGKRLQWVEMRMKGKKPNQNVIYQMLVPGSLMEMSQVEEIVFKPAEKPAMKMSGPLLSMIRGELVLLRRYVQRSQPGGKGECDGSGGQLSGASLSERGTCVR